MLFSSEETQNFRNRWNEVQAKFVDEPGSSVREADTLVAEVMEKITKMFAGQRQTLESQWSKGDTSTEDLRQVLQHYRAFFNRLLK
jgi:DNA-binding ferritin-like protein